MPSAIGEPLDRVDGRLKVTGRAAYTADNDLPHLTYGVLVTSTIAKGRIALIDTASARRSPGILAVLTHESHLRLAMSQDDISPQAPADRKLQLLQNDRVLYANQPVAVVVGETLEGAQEGARLVKIQYSFQTPSVGLDNGLAGAFIPERLPGGGGTRHKLAWRCRCRVVSSGRPHPTGLYIAIPDTQSDGASCHRRGVGCPEPSHDL